MNYQALGFKCGLEIHQRLRTRHKLFCRCPSELVSEEPKRTLQRRLRAVAGELGEVDPAAAFEVAKGKKFVYEAFSKQNCLVEEDEEPPRALNDEALDAVIQICNALGAKVLDEVHVMRKTVVDGSAVSAFQRTALVGVNGRISTSKGDVGIATVCIEEESAGIVEKTAGETRYRLDRLGIPLVEIATSASLKDPDHVMETAEQIGLLLRSSECVQRGIGTIRQDLNVSIAGGARIEIKGAQELSDLPALAENEVMRQKNLLEIIGEFKRRGLQQVAFGKPHSISYVFANAKPFLSNQIKTGAVALAIKLLFCKGLLGKEIMPGHRFGTELADYARVKGVRGIIHCDEDPSQYGLTQTDFELISRELDCIEDDGWALVVAEESRAISALRAVFDRAFTPALPKETRRAEGQISRFMRPLPGSARMYPETDVLPVVVSKERVKRAGSLRSFDEKKRGLLKKGVTLDLAEKILRSQDALLFEKLVEKFSIEPKTIAWLLTDVKPMLRREGFIDLRIDEVLALLRDCIITKAAVTDLLRVGAKEPGVPLKDLAKASGLQRISGSPLKELAASLNNDFAEVIKRYRLQVDPAELKTILNR